MKITSEPRRSKRLAEKQLRKTHGQLPGSPQPVISDPVQQQPKRLSSIHTPSSQFLIRNGVCVCLSCKKLRHANSNSNPATALETQVQIPPALLQMEQNCSDAEWVWLRWNGVSTENHVSWDHVLTRRGKFLQLACASRDVSLVKAVYEISQSPQSHDNDKWRFVDAVHYAVEYQLHELLPWLSTINQANEETQATSSLLMNMALSNGDLFTAKWLFENRPSVQNELILQSTKQALGKHSLELLQWVVAHYPAIFLSVPTTQQEPVGLESVLRRLRGENVFQSAGDEAVACGNLNAVQYLYTNKLEVNFSKQALSAAAAHSHLEVL